MEVFGFRELIYKTADALPPWWRLLAWSRCHRRRAFLSPAPVPNGVAATLQTRVSPQ